MTIQIARTPKQAKSSAAAKPSAAEKFYLGSPPTTALQLARTAKLNAAARPTAAKKGGSGGVPLNYGGTTQHAHAQWKAKRSGQAERSGEEGLGVSTDYANPTRTHAEEGQAERSGQAKRSGKGGSGVFPDYDYPTRTHADESQTKRSGQAERSGKGGFGGLSPTTAIQLARTPKKTKLSAAARPNAAEKGVRGSPLAATLYFAHAMKRVPLHYNSNQRAAKARTAAESSAGRKIKRRLNR
jgi:hypothetical protein